MKPSQEKAWNLLTDNEKNALYLQLSQGQSSWEAGEILQIPHYKYLELKERSIKFFKMFTEYFEEFNSLIPPNSVIDDRFRDFIEGIIEKRLTKKEALSYTGDSSMLVHEISSKVIIRNMKRLVSSENIHDNRLHDLIIEFDRWNNKRILPREIQLPSAYKRRWNKRDKTYIRYISNIPESKIKAIIKLFSYRPYKSNSKAYYITLISSNFDDGYLVLSVKPDKKTVQKLSKLSIFIFKDKDMADTFGFIITRFLENPQNPKSGQKFWSNYREHLENTINKDQIDKNEFFSEKLDVAYEIPKRRNKLKKLHSVKSNQAKRVNPEFFYSKK